MFLYYTILVDNKFACLYAKEEIMAIARIEERNHQYHVINEKGEETFRLSTCGTKIVGYTSSSFSYECNYQIHTLDEHGKLLNTRAC